MLDIKALEQFLASKLDCNIKDYGPNGLQVAGNRGIKKLVVGVSASQDFLAKAIACDADAILVHHGLFWFNQASVLVGPMYHKVKLLLDAGVSLFAYHLPLDFHPVLGNNQALADHLGWKTQGMLDAQPIAYGHTEDTSEDTSIDAFAKVLHSRLGHVPTVVPAGTHAVQRLAWCTGAGGDFISAVAQAGFNTFVTGEIAERQVHMARELGVHLIAAGHHATERYGVQAVANMLGNKFGIETQFIDEYVPV